MEYERVKKKLAKADSWNQIADNCRKRYIELLEKNQGVRWADVPTEDIEEMGQCLKSANKADKEWNKLMKEVDAYGSK